MLSKESGGFLKPLDDGLTSGSYEGFVLKKNFLYGRNRRGDPIATSGFLKDGNLLIYEKTAKGWMPKALPLEEAKELLSEEGLQEILENRQVK